MKLKWKKNADFTIDRSRALREFDRLIKELEAIQTARAEKDGWVSAFTCGDCARRCRTTVICKRFKKKEKH